MANPATANQQPLSKPVCGAGCTLLSGHSGKHTAENGRQWK